MAAKWPPSGGHRRVAAVAAICREVALQWLAGVVSPAKDMSDLRLPQGLATLLAPRCMAALLPDMAGIKDGFDVLPVQTDADWDLSSMTDARDAALEPKPLNPTSQLTASSAPTAKAASVMAMMGDWMEHVCPGSLNRALQHYVAHHAHSSTPASALLADFADVTWMARHCNISHADSQPPPAHAWQEWFNSPETALVEVAVTDPPLKGQWSAIVSQRRRCPGRGAGGAACGARKAADLSVQVEDPLWVPLSFSAVNRTGMSAPLAWSPLAESAAGVDVPWAPESAGTSMIIANRVAARAVYTALSQEAKLEQFLGSTGRNASAAQLAAARRLLQDTIALGLDGTGEHLVHPITAVAYIWAALSSPAVQSAAVGSPYSVGPSMLAIGVPALRGLTQLMAQLKAAKALLGDGTGGLSFCDEQLEAALYERVLTPLVEATLGALPQQPSNATSSPQLRSWDRVAWGLSAVPVLSLAARSGLWTPGAEQCGRVLVHLDSGSALEDREVEIVPAVMASAVANGCGNTTAAAVRAKLQQCANAAEPLADAAQCARALSRAGTQDAMQAVLEIALGSDTRFSPATRKGLLQAVLETDGGGALAWNYTAAHWDAAHPLARSPEWLGALASALALASADKGAMATFLEANLAVADDSHQQGAAHIIMSRANDMAQSLAAWSTEYADAVCISISRWAVNNLVK